MAAAPPGPREVPRTGGPVTSEDAINLGGTVGPALLKAYGAKLALAVLVLAVVVWLVRRRRH